MLSTGDELVEINEIPIGSQIRDSNRHSLISSLKADGLKVIDYGIVRDKEADLEARMVGASADCDIVITTGGVSMGVADLVKPLLAKLGVIHFGRLNMKPGKPTTFATIPKAGGGQTLFFGLPGNPVSCLVTKSLLIEPCIRKLQGLQENKCLHPRVSVTLQSKIVLDPERPEYHRARVFSSRARADRLLGDVDLDQSGLVAWSTGDQRSSRLMSMKSYNALLCLPQGSSTKGAVAEGEQVTALLIAPLLPPDASVVTELLPSVNSSSSSASASAVQQESKRAKMDLAAAAASSTATTTHSPAPAARRPMRIALLTVSDRVRSVAPLLL